jgi:hypothetical protein
VPRRPSQAQVGAIAQPHRSMLRSALLAMRDCASRSHTSACPVHASAERKLGPSAATRW